MTETLEINTDYLNEAYGAFRPPMVTAQDYMNEIAQYRECVEKVYFTKTELAVFFALQKAHGECIRVPIKNPGVDVPGAEDQAKLLLASKLEVGVDDIEEIIFKINDGLNKNRMEKKK